MVLIRAVPSLEQRSLDPEIHLSVTPSSALAARSRQKSEISGAAPCGRHALGDLLYRRPGVDERRLAVTRSRLTFTLPAESVTTLVSKP